MTTNWTALRKRSALIRKSWDYARQIPRGAVRLSVVDGQYRTSPPLIANSFPKSGTHQLLQILEAFPGARHYGSFIASMPSFPFRERSESAHIRRIHSIVPGEYLGAHIFFKGSYAQAIDDMNAVHFFIYRDLRDVAVSEAFYLKNMNRWHQMHDHFARRLKSDDERLMTAIEGVRDPDFPFDYPDIATRMRRYLPWIASRDVFALKYEDLNSDRRGEIVRAMISFYAQRTNSKVDVEEVRIRALKKIDPTRSHTFRVGGVGKWRRAFGEQHLQTFQRVAEDLNISLGYAPC